MSASTWHDLSDDELLARLMARGIHEREAWALIAHRDDPVERPALDALLDDR